MALSRIWSAFILIAVMVAGYKFMTGDRNILSRMVTGKADDAYDTVYYHMIGAPTTTSKENYQKMLEGYGYYPADSIQLPSVVIAASKDEAQAQSNLPTNTAISFYTFNSIKAHLHKHADGIIETCKTAVNICIGLIGIMALFMGLMSIAEKAGGIRVLSKIIGPFFSKLFPEVPK